MQEAKMLQIRMKERQKAQEHNHIHVPVPCNCGDTICKDWHVIPDADVHGVSFTEEQARLVAKTLNDVLSN